MAITRVTREQQAAAGFDNPRDFSDALTEAENATPQDNLQDAQENLNNVPIVSNDIQDVRDIKFTQPDPQIGAVGLQGQIDELLTQEQATREREAKDAEQVSSQSLQDITSFLEGTVGETELTARAQRETGIPEIQKELDVIDQQIRAEQNALRRQIERIETGAGLATKTQRNISAQEAERQSLRKQADLSIIRLGIQGRFDSAQALAKQKVDVQMERDERKLAALTMTYNNNKDLFTKKEQRAFEASQTRMKNEIAEKREALTQINTLALTLRQNEAPNELVLQALESESINELLSIPGISNHLKSKEQKLQEQLLGLKITSEIEAANAAKNAREAGVLTADQAKLADDLRKEYNGLQEVKDAKDLEANTTSLLLALEQEDGVSDISAINTFQRLVVDPGVAVREGDVSLLQSAMSFTDKAVLRAKGLMVGDKLTETARAQMKDLALGVYDARKAIVEAQTKPIQTRASESGIEFGKYIGNEFSTADEIKNRVGTIDPAQTILDSYDEDVFSEDYTVDTMFQPWLNNLPL